MGHGGFHTFKGDVGDGAAVGVVVGDLVFGECGVGEDQGFGGTGAGGDGGPAVVGWAEE